MRFDWPIKSFFIESVKEDIKAGKFHPEKFVEISPQEFLQRVRQDVANGTLKPSQIISGKRTNLRKPRKPRRNFSARYKKARRACPVFNQ